MKYGLSDYTLHTMQALFKKHPAIRAVTLYGSRAKGNFRPGSDIDITLHTDETFTNKDLLALHDQFDESDMPYFVDVSIYDKLNNPDLKAHIQRVGQPLYGDLYEIG
jgi:predicted nucleotidyltransferase